MTGLLLFPWMSGAVGRLGWPRWLVAGCLVAGGTPVGSCQVRGDQLAASRPAAAPAALGPAAPTTTAAIVSILPAAILDSLALTPVPGLPAVPAPLAQAIGQLHAALGPAAAELRPEVLTQACVGYLTLRARGGAPRPGAVLAVADLDLPNTTPRLWVIDLKNQRVRHHSLVAHGCGSGHLRARHFSDTPGSACSSLGFYRTAETYDGKHGLSRYLQGLDPGQNGSAAARDVVLHGADYASPAYVARHGHLGYSRGCPALPPQQYAAIIRALPAGRVLLLSGPGLASRWLDGARAGQRFAAHGWE